MMQTIVMHTPKGGSGKSTIAREIAAAAGIAGETVALADMDPQGTTAGWYRRRNAEAPAMVSLQEEGIAAQVKRLGQAGASLLVIDTPPAYPAFMGNLIAVADLVLIPVRPTPDDLLAAAPIAKSLKTHPCWAFVLSQVPPRTRLLASAIRQLASIGRVAPAQITIRADYPNAAIDGTAAVEMTGKAAAEVSDLYAWINTTLRDTYGETP